MFNFKDMMGRIQEMQDKLQEAKDQLNDVLVESEAGGGMVKVTANANRKILKIIIDPDIIDKNEPEMMSDLITAAVNKTLEEAEEKGREELQNVTKGVLPNIPGLDLGKFGFQG
ncbi:MAG: YbaB/EbfC family nucleoid-associated protein [Bacteroidota bacterium]